MVFHLLAANVWMDLTPVFLFVYTGVILTAIENVWNSELVFLFEFSAENGLKNSTRCQCKKRLGSTPLLFINHLCELLCLSSRYDQLDSPTFCRSFCFIHRYSETRFKSFILSSSIILFQHFCRKSRILKYLSFKGTPLIARCVYSSPPSMVHHRTILSQTHFLFGPTPKTFFIWRFSKWSLSFE